MCTNILYIYIYDVRMYYKAEVVGDASRKWKQNILLRKRRNRLLILREHCLRAISLLLPSVLTNVVAIVCASAREP